MQIRVLVEYITDSFKFTEGALHGKNYKKPKFRDENVVNSESLYTGNMAWHLPTHIVYLSTEQMFCSIRCMN